MFSNLFSVLLTHNLTQLRSVFTSFWLLINSVEDPGGSPLILPCWIRIQQDKNDPQKNKVKIQKSFKKFHVWSAWCSFFAGWRLLRLQLLNFFVCLICNFCLGHLNRGSGYGCGLSTLFIIFRFAGGGWGGTRDWRRFSAKVLSSFKNNFPTFTGTSIIIFLLLLLGSTSNRWGQ